MNRRQMLSATGSALFAAAAGCLTRTSSTQDETTDEPTTQRTTEQTTTEAQTDAWESTTTADPLNLPDDRVYDVDEEAQHDSILVWVDYIGTQATVSYNNPEEGSIKTWDPGSTRMIAYASIWAENLTNESNDNIPHWENFEFVTPRDTVSPRLHTPDGTSAQEIRDGEHIPSVTFLKNTGVRANSQTGWAAVFNAPRADFENVAVKWDIPQADDVYWRPEN